MNERKAAEGREHMKNAEKCLKTSFLKWQPDLDGAASEYGKAAVAFKNGKAFEQAIAAYLKAADVQKQGGSAFHAAKSFEAASLIYKDMKELNKAGELVERASLLYIEHGIPDTAALALERGAKFLEQDLPSRAVYLYEKAADVAEANDNIHQCAELTGKACRILIRQRKLEEAIAMLKKEMDFYHQMENNGIINKLVFGLVLLHLHQEDFVAADQAFKASTSYKGFAESEEAGAIEQLLESYEEGDSDTARSILNNPLFRYMENDFVKLARSLHLPGDGTGQVSAAGGGGKLAQYGGPDENDEYSGGLL